MMTTLTFNSTNPETECRVLVFALQEWLKEQPEAQIPVSKTNFYYDEKGILSVVDVVLDGD